jgi:RHH-type proline utilization regulon transcriptional repressor/proline dehydrogenase/delta 1-pyrroline-5-carboxylate dehydrogenase
VRLHKEDSLFETLARIAAVKISGCKLWISIPKGMVNGVTRFLNEKEGQRLIGKDPVFHEADHGLIKSMSKVNRIRYAEAGRIPQEVFEAAAETGFYIARRPIMMDGRIELLQYFQQQSICNNYHRYGNLGERGLEHESK